MNKATRRTYLRQLNELRYGRREPIPHRGDLRGKWGNLRAKVTRYLDSDIFTLLGLIYVALCLLPGCGGDSITEPPTEQRYQVVCHDGDSGEELGRSAVYTGRYLTVKDKDTGVLREVSALSWYTDKVTDRILEACRAGAGPCPTSINCRAVGL